MDVNTTRKNFSDITETLCEYTSHEIYKYMSDDARFYV